MSLPPTLLKRLASRGLISKQKGPPATEAIEEIIAENYDEDDKPHQYGNPDRDTGSSTKLSSSNDTFWKDRIKERIGVTESYHGFKFCPNKYNIWHTCTLYCVNKWTTGKAKPNERYMRRHRRLLRKYPLGPDWKETFDSGCGAYYFYNSSTRKVSWLPPSHPKARISNSAASLRKQLANSNDKSNFDADDANDENDSEDESQPTFYVPAKKQKVRDLERTISRKQR